MTEKERLIIQAINANNPELGLHSYEISNILGENISGSTLSSMVRKNYLIRTKDGKSYRYIVNSNPHYWE